MQETGTYTHLTLSLEISLSWGYLLPIYSVLITLKRTIPFQIPLQLIIVKNGFNYFCRLTCLLPILLWLLHKRYLTSTNDLPQRPSNLFRSFFKFQLTTHHAITINKALQILDFIKCNTKTFTSASCLRIFYLVLTRSVLEYGGVTWHR